MNSLEIIRVINIMIDNTKYIKRKNKIINIKKLWYNWQK